LQAYRINVELNESFHIGSEFFSLPTRWFIWISKLYE